jgi:hypothetical protein
MGKATACRLLVGRHKSADAGFGVGPKAATSAQLAHELPVVGGFAAKVALGHFMGLEERINLGNYGMCHTSYIPKSIQHHK